MASNKSDAVKISEVSYKIHQVMFFEEASKLLLSINWESCQRNMSRCDVAGNSATLRAISRMAPVLFNIFCLPHIAFIHVYYIISVLLLL